MLSQGGVPPLEWVRNEINHTLTQLHNAPPMRGALLGRNGTGKSFVLNLLLFLTCVSALEYASAMFRAGQDENALEGVCVCALSAMRARLLALGASKISLVRPTSGR